MYTYDTRTLCYYSVLLHYICANWKTLKHKLNVKEFTDTINAFKVVDAQAQKGFEPNYEMAAVYQVNG